MIVSLKELLKQDLTSKVIIFPTDTVYGIGCLLNDEEAIHRIYQIKDRDYSKPFALLASSLEQIKPLVQDISLLEPYASKYWPGALTLVTNKSTFVKDIITSSFPTVGIRIPNHPVALQILDHFGPMVVTSLNLSSQPAILKYEDTLPFHSLVDFVIDGGDLQSKASTVFDTINHKVLRQGDIVIL